MHQFLVIADVGIWATFKGWIAQFIEILFNFTQTINLPSYALAILILTIIIKVVLYPLTRTSMRSSQAMQRLQPLMKEVEAKYKSNPQQYQLELQKLYKEHNVKPLSGCLPLLIQMPILFALFQTMKEFTPNHPDHYSFLWVDNLGAADPTIAFPIIVALSMLLQQFLSTTNKKDPMQRSMMIIMPIMFGFFARSFPVGLCIYWTSYNIVGSIQQLFINRSAKKDREEFEAKLEAEQREKEEKKQKQKEAKAKAKAGNAPKTSKKEPSRSLTETETFSEEDNDDEYEIDYEAIRPYDRKPKKKKKQVVEENIELDEIKDAEDADSNTDYSSLIENYSEDFGQEISDDEVNNADLADASEDNQDK